MERKDLAVGMRVQLKKLHPCGGDEWKITRTGADVGLECCRCRRRVMIEREECERRIKHILPTPATEQGDNSL